MPPGHLPPPLDPRLAVEGEQARRYLSADEADEYVDGLRVVCELVDDRPDPPAVARDPKDDYLVALTNTARADTLVSVDHDLLVLSSPRVLTPRQSLSLTQDPGERQGP